jgi:hypothetical protein
MYDCGYEPKYITRKEKRSCVLKSNVGTILMTALLLITTLYFTIKGCFGNMSMMCLHDCLSVLQVAPCHIYCVSIGHPLSSIISTVGSSFNLSTFVCRLLCNFQDVHSEIIYYNLSWTITLTGHNTTCVCRR